MGPFGAFLKLTGSVETEVGDCPVAK
jgi:hypothetical protein